jgi:RimJ/RimL family protein N-acetyltransferase
VISGARVVLVPKSLADARRDYTWQKDEELARLTGNAPLRGSFVQYLTRHAAGYCAQGSILQLSIKTIADGRHIGNCAVYNLSVEGSGGELGIIIGERAFWGRGYGYDAVQALLGHMFQGMGLQRVHLTTLFDNTRAQRCFARCGFRVNGSTVRGGYTFLLMELRAEDFARRGLAEMAGRKA